VGQGYARGEGVSRPRAKISCCERPLYHCEDDLNCIHAVPSFWCHIRLHCTRMVRGPSAPEIRPKPLPHRYPARWCYHRARERDELLGGETARFLAIGELWAEAFMVGRQSTLAR
jgi:hypothetical protein